MDNTGIYQGILSTGSSTDDTSLTINGSISSALISGETVRIYDGVTYLGNALVSGTTWIFADARTLTNGQVVSYTARVADAANNQSVAGIAYTVTIDTSAPTTTAVITAVIDNVGNIQGTVISGGTTDDTSLTIIGSLTAYLLVGETLRVYDGSSYLGDAIVSGMTWSYVDGRTLANGQSVSVVRWFGTNLIFRSRGSGSSGYWLNYAAFS